MKNIQDYLTEQWFKNALKENHEALSNLLRIDGDMFDPTIELTEFDSKAYHKLTKQKQNDLFKSFYDWHNNNIQCINNSSYIEEVNTDAYVTKVAETYLVKPYNLLITVIGEEDSWNGFGCEDIFESKPVQVTKTEYHKK